MKPQPYRTHGETPPAPPGPSRDPWYFDARARGWAWLALAVAVLYAGTGLVCGRAGCLVLTGVLVLLLAIFRAIDEFVDGEDWKR